MQIAGDAGAFGFGGALLLGLLAIMNFRLQLASAFLDLPLQFFVPNQNREKQHGKGSRENEHALQIPPRRCRQNADARGRIQQQFETADGSIGGAVALRHIDAGQLHPAAGGRQIYSRRIAVHSRLECKEPGLEFQHLFGTFAPLVHQCGVHLNQRAGRNGPEQVLRRKLCRRRQRRMAGLSHQAFLHFNDGSSRLKKTDGIHQVANGNLGWIFRRS